MLFNSGVFLQFLAGFLLLYWIVRNNIRWRNILIVVASNVFYGWWDYRFLLLLWISSFLDFFIGLALDNSQDPRRRKWLVGASVTGQLSILGFFKYYDFFIESLQIAGEKWGVSLNVKVLGIILPMGISFYTFQTMSYTIDVYRRELKATRNVIDFLAFVSFFPQLVAGPIERASHMLPQFGRTRIITSRMLEEGVWLCLWGLFKKVAIADNLAPMVDMVFQDEASGVAHYTAPAVILGTVAFAFQIYCDFSGYSDIARGLARILGFEIMVNFKRPYAATSIRDFWRRWHISLSTWLRDYLYVSLGGNRRGPALTYFNLIVTMFLGGLWHGAAWNFILWGFWHGFGLAGHRFIAGRVEKDQATPRPRIWVAVSWILTMLFVLYGWLLFRAKTFQQIRSMTLALGDFTAPAWLTSYMLNLAVYVVPLALMEFWQSRARSEDGPVASPLWVKGLLQGTLLLGILFYWEKAHVPFIYFQF